ncbi:MAG: NepR family anti-sigma factor [Litorimonas sp.]
MSNETNKPGGGSAKPRPSEQAFDSAPLPDKIGSSLRNLYDEVLNEDVPDDFLNLLRKADDKSSKSAGGRA